MALKVQSSMMKKYFNVKVGLQKDILYRWKKYYFLYEFSILIFFFFFYTLHTLLHINVL